MIPCIISAWHDFNKTCKYKQVRASNFDRILGPVQECHKGNPNSQSLDWTKYPLHSGLTHSILTPQRRIKRLETHYVSGGKNGTLNPQFIVFESDGGADGRGGADGGADEGADGRGGSGRGSGRTSGRERGGGADKGADGGGGGGRGL